jgi:hypothetical protein
VIAWLWNRRDVSFDLKAAALAAAMTLASPYQFVYDLVILTIAQAFLLRHFAKVGAADAVEIRGLALANCLVLLFAKTPVPLGIIASAMVMALILRRVWIERSADAAEQLGAPCPSAVLPAAGA